MSEALGDDAREGGCYVQVLMDRFDGTHGSVLSGDGLVERVDAGALGFDYLFGEHDVVARDDARGLRRFEQTLIRGVGRSEIGLSLHTLGNDGGNLGMHFGALGASSGALSSTGSCSFSTYEPRST